LKAVYPACTGLWSCPMLDVEKEPENGEKASSVRECDRKHKAKRYDKIKARAGK
jgi:hypothetical protein